MLTIYSSMNLRSTLSTKAAVISTLLMQSQLITMVYAICGWEIHKTIKSRAMSEKLKNLHSRALSMLISQVGKKTTTTGSICLARTLNPLMFLFVPAFAILFGMFLDTDFGALPKVLINYFLRY
ncbi:hypothetical protein PFISCL1PPCAC_12597 [Pristionchus fissidentatus]|uniref:G protein-coupled receptor n=1 Tax=Pristionchus fissidentatus TaxID=1538716 RepID=A0AAV5VTF0_9BILA|nr:hypothetical protein PFISCL1PPCAC_12597 [Pristionchus fissidentatus]